MKPKPEGTGFTTPRSKNTGSPRKRLNNRMAGHLTRLLPLRRRSSVQLRVASSLVYQASVIATEHPIAGFDAAAEMLHAIGA